MNDEKAFSPDTEEKLQQEILKKYASEIRERWTSDHSGLAEAMFRKAGASKATIKKVREAGAEGARAFFIALIIEKFGFSYSSDILLADMGLLDGYQKESGVMERRKQYFIESNYRSEDNPDGKDNKDVDAAVLDDRAANLNKVDVPLFRKLVLYFDGIEDKDAFFKSACSRYLDVPKNSSGALKVHYPAPHYKIRFENPVKHLPLAENEDFCGREDILGKIDEGFQARYERSVQMLYGMGGVGKTEIALKYVYDHLDDYSTVVWLDATSIQKLEEDVRRFLSQYSSKGIEGLSDTESTAIAFCRFINQRVNSLIILDNADYIDRNSETGESEFIRLNWFIPKKNAHILITTRCDVSVRGIKRIVVDVFQPEVALDFLYRKTGEKPNEAAIKLAEQLGYLPLALEYLGAYIVMQGIPYESYLRKWERIGIDVFDKNYTVTTIRKAFHISLAKIRTPYALDFLQFFSELGVVILPLQEFIDAMRAQTQRIREEVAKPNSEQFVVQNNPNGKKRVFKIVNVCEDGSFEVVDVDEPYEHGTIPQSPFIKALDNEMTRDEIVRELKSYSLITWNHGVVRMHPLLQEIIIDECFRASKNALVGQTPISLLREAYLQSGNNEEANQALNKIVCDGITHIEHEINNLPIFASKARKSGSKLFNYWEDLDLITELAKKAKECGDDKLVNRCEELEKQLKSMEKELSDVIPYDPDDDFRIIIQSGEETIEIPYTGL